MPSIVRTVRREDGFTLIELLVVIVIIGILSSVVLSKITSARVRAQQAKTLTNMKSTQDVAVSCSSLGHNLTTPDVSQPMCNGEGNWSGKLGAGWSYGDAGGCAFDGEVSDGTFMFCATNGTHVIACTQRGCSVS